MSKWYVVSEGEMQTLLATAYQAGLDEELLRHNEAFLAAQAACRARPVPDWATHFVSTDEIPVRGGDMFIQECEEIRK